MLFRSSLLGASALLFMHAHAQAAAVTPVVIELRANAVIEHARVTLSDIATLQADARTAAALGTVDLGHAPRIGYAERLTRAQIELLIRRHAAVGDVAIDWHGPGTVAMHTAAQTVSGATLTTAAIAAAQTAYAAPDRQLDIAAPAQVADVDVPVGALQIRPRSLDGIKLAQRMPLWLDLLVDGAVYRSVVVQLQPSMRQNAYIAKRAIEQGAWAGPDDFTVAQAELAGVQAVPVGPVLAPFRAAKALKAGQILSLPAQAPGGKVLRGDQVRLLVRAGQIGIETTATALADAGPGQLLQVRPSGGKDIIAGRVDPSGTVTIE